jgi:large subunit ribosomal protein L25
MQEVAIQAESREELGNGPGRRLRANGRIPAVVYGLGRPNVAVSVDTRELDHLVHESGEHAMIALQVGDGGEVEHVLLRETQRDPITDRLIHADFFRIDPSKPVEIEVPIRAQGVAVGQKTGGVLEQLLRTIEIRCLPSDMPAFLEFDVTDIAVGHSLHVGDISVSGDLVVLTPPDTALFTVVAPRALEEEEEEAEAAEGEEITEPELVGKEEEEEEGEDEEKGKSKDKE